MEVPFNPCSSVQTRSIIVDWQIWQILNEKKTELENGVERVLTENG